MPEASPPFPVDRTERGLVHRASALFVAAGLLLVTLTACSTNPNDSCDPNNGGAYVMWKGTPYAHIMVPVAKRPPVALKSPSATQK